MANRFNHNNNLFGVKILLCHHEFVVLAVQYGAHTQKQREPYIGKQNENNFVICIAEIRADLNARNQMETEEKNANRNESTERERVGNKEYYYGNCNFEIRKHCGILKIWVNKSERRLFIVYMKKCCVQNWLARPSPYPSHSLVTLFYFFLFAQKYLSLFECFPNQHSNAM